MVSLERSAGISKYLPQLDGLRALAVLAVVFVHYRHYIPGGMAFKWGWLGVDVFFVLSGFLCTRILIDQQTSWTNAGKFIARRMLRTWPVYFAVVFVLVVLGLARWSPYIFYGQNLMASNSQYLNHTWSLAVEEQFYVVLPILWMVMGRKYLPYAFGIMILVAVASRAYYLTLGNDAAAAYLRPWTRIDGMAIGGLLAYATMSKWVARVAAALMIPLILAVQFLSETGKATDVLVNAGVYGGPLLQLFVSLSTAGIISLCLRSGAMTKLLSWQPLVDIGKVSYGIYIFHLVVMVYCRRLTGEIGWYFPGWSAKWVGLFTAFILTVVLTKGSYRFLEKPFLSLKKYF